MSSRSRPAPGAILRWLDRWRYLAAITPCMVILLIGMRQAESPALNTLTSFARYMAVVAALGLGVAVARPLNHYLQSRYRPWQAPDPPKIRPWMSDFSARWRWYGGLVSLSYMAGIVVTGACLALIVVADELGVLP